MIIIKVDNFKSIYMVLEQVVCGTSFLEKIRISPMSWPFLKHDLFWGGFLKCQNLSTIRFTTRKCVLFHFGFH
jgi:hypothetical protein